MRATAHIAHRRLVAVVGTLVLTLVTTGCGLSDPYGHAPATTSNATAPRVVDNEVRPVHPYRGGSPPATPAATPEQAIERFAALYVNWTYRTLAAHRLQLARIAVGAAAAAQRRGAAESAHDYELAQGRVSNRGELVAVAARRGASAGEYVVVTRETTTGIDTYEGLPAAYHVTLVTVQAVPGGWAVSAWEPQS